QKSQEALAADAPFSGIIALPVHERIGRIKYVPEDEVEAEFDAIVAELDKELAELTGEGKPNA
ncbi:MAG: hypothetical protein J6V01_08815, partial [Clostridia bacterium]|nr:hypothetical protein [Clostridia bacterium]